MNLRLVPLGTNLRSAIINFMFALDHAVASPLPAAMVSRSLAKHPPRVLDPHLVGDAGR